MKDEIITSLQNPRIKAVAALRDRRDREREGAILIDGRREVVRALLAGVRVRELYYCTALLGAREVGDILGPAREAGAELTAVSEPVFGKISYGERAEGVVAVAERPNLRLADLKAGERPLIAVIEAVEKPGNLGAVLRSADGAGVEAMIAADPATDIYGPNVIRSSLGAVFSVPLVEATAAETVRWLQDRRMTIIAATPDDGVVYTEIDLTGPVAVILGSEARGLTGVWNAPGVIRARVPMLGVADSLNVSATAALFFYEALRQRSRARPGAV